MKWIHNDILDILHRVKDLLRIERKMRSDRVSIEPGRGGGGIGNPKSETRPWKPLPNIRKFKIEIQLKDWLLLLFGFEKRYSPSLELYPWLNGKANKYVDYMFKRLRRQVELKMYDEAFVTFNLLLNSSAYRILSFNYVARGWYKNMNWKVCKKVLKSVKSLCKTKAIRIDFKRVYLETANKIRPLGVPTLPWRVYLHMLNNLIVQWRLVSEGSSQHGYLPKRGLITAWEALFSKINSCPHIFEADFKGFFDNVKHSAIKEELKLMGFPHLGIRFLIRLNKALVELDPEQEDLIKEPTRNILFHVDGDINEDSDIREELESLIAYEDGENFEYTLWTPEYFGASVLTGTSADEYRRANKEEGVPQGAATSCSLSTLVLRYLERTQDLILYADDILLFPSSGEVNPLEEGCLNSKERGITAHDAKSGWVKRNNVWLKDLKFVGFTYSPPSKWDLNWDTVGIPSILFLLIDFLTVGFPLWSLVWLLILMKGEKTRCREIFRASTRKGATLEFTHRESFLAYLNNARTLLLNSSAGGVLGGQNLREWLQSRSVKWLKLLNPTKLLFDAHMTKYKAPKYIPHISLTGWFFSRMQLGSWYHSIEQDFRLKWHSTSWISVWWPTYRLKHGLKPSELTTFTASSFACHGLLEFAKSSKSRRTKIRRVFNK